MTSWELSNRRGRGQTLNVPTCLGPLETWPSQSPIYTFSTFSALFFTTLTCSVLVALNFQTEGTMMDLYLGKFRQNGNSGFILKPEHMRNGMLFFMRILLVYFNKILIILIL